MQTHHNVTKVDAKVDARPPHRPHRRVQLLQRVAVEAGGAVEAGAVLLVRVLHV